MLQEEVLNLIKDSSKHPSKDELKLAIKQEQRVRFHTSNFNFDYYKFDPTTSSEFVALDAMKNIKLGKHGDSINTDFFLWVKSILDNTKYLRFLQLFELVSAELIEEIFVKLSRCTEAQDRVSDVYFKDEKTQLDFEAYRTTTLKDEEFFTEDIFESELQSNYNGVIVVDYNKNNEVKFFTITAPQIEFLEVDDEEGYIKYIAFRTSEKDTLYVYCDTHYRVYDTSNKEAPFLKQDEYAHNLGYCPATFLYNSDLESRISRIVKKNPVCKYVDKLDFLLFLNTGKKYLDTYSYPIMEVPAKECNYTDIEGNDCNGGYITTIQETENGNKTYQKRCPNCEKNKFIGAGTVIEKEISVNADNETLDYLGEVVKFTAPPVDILQNVSQNLESLKREIISKTTGFSENSNDSQAKNELQVTSYYESQVSVLQKFQKPLEEAQKFVLKTVAKLMYPNDYLYSIVDWGKDYYLRSMEELLKQLETLQNSNAPKAAIDLVQDEILSQKLKNKPNLRVRNELIERINMYNDYSFEELKYLFENNLISDVGFSLATNFNYYLDKFEVENGQVTAYKPNLSLNARISEIQTKLQDYVRLPNAESRETTERTSNSQGQAANE